MQDFIVLQELSSQEPLKVAPRLALLLLLMFFQVERQELLNVQQEAIVQPNQPQLLLAQQVHTMLFQDKEFLLLV